jgi:DNA modification methylase
MNIYNDDCFNIFPKIEDKSINLFLLDLPYANKKFGNCTACAWDTPIDLEKMWVEIKRTMKPNGLIVFFCNTKFGYALINSNPKWFKYDLIWEKSRKVGFLSANKQPLRKHENIYIFKDKGGTYNPQKTEGHTTRIRSHNKNANCNIIYGDDVKIQPLDTTDKRHPTSILPEFEETHENIYIFKDKVGTYNPQKTEADKIRDWSKTKQTNNGSYYRKEGEGYKSDFKKESDDGFRHPTSILPEFEETHENIYVFDNTDDETSNLAEYSKKILNFINKPKTEIKKKIKDADHFFRYSKDNFSLCNEETYNKLIEIYKINEMEGFYPYKEIKRKYNPQMTEGKPYKTTESSLTNSYYRDGVEYKSTAKDNKGDRHPTSILPEFEETHENIYIFDNKEDDIEIVRNLELRKYAEKVKNYIGKTKKELMKEIGQGIDHFFRFNSSQFGLPIKDNYDKLTKLYDLKKMEGFLKFDDMKKLEELETYNPQKTEGKPYKTNGRDNIGCYGKDYHGDPVDNKGDRHPTSILPEFETTILKYNNPHKTIHRTQKPVDLLEWLIKTYTNEDDLVMDFCMGSGSCGVACMNTKRKFIGVERDEDIFKLAEKRLEDNKNLIKL